jgi:hypothetical protein
MSVTAKIKYFPFSPGIGWKIKNGKYVVPEINLDVWKKIVDDKKITIVAYGGFLESYFSLCYLEILNYLIPNNKIQWCGNTFFNTLVHLNGIATININCPQSLLSRYPTPIFMDRDKNIYFNCLNNYQIVKPYYGGFGYKDKSPIVKQILRNSLTSWENHYIPKFRRLGSLNDGFINWSKVNKFNLRNPYICFFYDVGWSEHKLNFRWNENQVKSLAAMLKQQGISMLLFTKHPYKFYNSSAYCIGIDLENIINLIPKSIAVLSDCIDLSFLAMMLSDSSKIITKSTGRKLSLLSNVKFLGLARNNIFIKKLLTPLDVFYTIVDK